MLSNTKASSLTAFSQQLKAAGYLVQVKKDNPQVNHSKRLLSSQFLQRLKKDKAILIQLLQQPNVNTRLINEPVALKPSILFSVQDVNFTQGTSMTVISRDDHTPHAMTLALYQQFGINRIAAISQKSYYAK